MCNNKTDYVIGFSYKSIQNAKLLEKFHRKNKLIRLTRKVKNRTYTMFFVPQCSGGLPRSPQNETTMDVLSFASDGSYSVKRSEVEIVYRYLT